MTVANAKAILAEIQVALDKLCDVWGNVPAEVARSAIANSAIWLTHSSGPCDAPGHARSIAGSERNWYIKFGRNTFNVAEAIQRCRRTIKVASVEWSKNNPLSRTRLYGKLRECLQQSVRLTNGGKYELYPLRENRLVFGATAIDADEFLRDVLKRVPVTMICAGRPAKRRVAETNVTKTDLKSPTKRCPHCGNAVKAGRFKLHISRKCARRP